MSDYEIEVARDSSGPQEDEGHPSHEHRLEAKGAETLHDFTNHLEMVHVGHFHGFDG